MPPSYAHWQQSTQDIEPTRIVGSQHPTLKQMMNSPYAREAILAPFGATLQFLVPWNRVADIVSKRLRRHRLLNLLQS
jgi:hypothetical protein